MSFGATVFDGSVSAPGRPRFLTRNSYYLLETLPREIDLARGDETEGMAQHGFAGRFRQVAPGAELHRPHRRLPFRLGRQENHRRPRNFGDQLGKPGKMLLPRLHRIHQHKGGTLAQTRQGRGDIGGIQDSDAGIPLLHEQGEAPAKQCLGIDDPDMPLGERDFPPALRRPARR